MIGSAISANIVDKQQSCYHILCNIHQPLAKFFFHAAKLQTNFVTTKRKKKKPRKDFSKRGLLLCYRTGGCSRFFENLTPCLSPCDQRKKKKPRKDFSKRGLLLCYRTGAVHVFGGTSHRACPRVTSSLGTSHRACPRVTL